MKQRKLFAVLAMLIAFAANARSGNAAQPTTTNELISRAMNATPDFDRGKALYQGRCSGCHGPQAWGVGIEEIPALAGQREFYLVTQLAQFLTQDRIGSTMHRAVASADIADPKSLRNLAAYLSEARVLHNPEHGDGLALGMGKQLFVSNCAQCHGKLAEGSESEPIPKLAGQHYPYLIAQLKSFAAGHRNQVEPPVLDFAAGLSPAQQAAIADYVSRIGAGRPGADE